MSTQAYEPGSPDAQVAARSSIEIEQTAKGDPKVRVKVYEGTPQDELERIRTATVAAYKATLADLAAGTQAAAA